MNPFLKTLIHAAIGGLAAGLMTLPTGVPITTSTVVYPALASMATSIFSLFSATPRTQ